MKLRGFKISGQVLQMPLPRIDSVKALICIDFSHVKTNQWSSLKLLSLSKKLHFKIDFPLHKVFGTSSNDVTELGYPKYYSKWSFNETV